ncbi:hypothetical protein MNBD_GAMMA24-1846 [hydrothermal vent metagenome]|uniref:Uncharacterized protein n=1 Tax=hydrothermal vent metagenome TaxID=652676 RepID=A0A3B1B2H3_9ZZZZ
MNKIIIRIMFLSVLLGLLNACSMGKLTVRASMPMIEGGIVAMNRETDLKLAQAAIPANMGMLEGMLVNDPENHRLHEYAAQAYYGYAYAFIEDHDRKRAAKLYYRGFRHGKAALAEYDLDQVQLTGRLDVLQKAVNQLQRDAVPALFWTASNWAKWIDMKRDSVRALAQMSRVVILMQRVLELDENYFLSGADLFFGVYYGSRSPMMGGNFALSEKHFNRARKNTDNKILLADLLQAQYLERQRFDRAAFHQRLQQIVAAPADLYPAQAFINTIAKQKARELLKREDEWF